MNLIDGLHEEIDRVSEIKKIYDEQPNNASALAAGFFMKLSITKAKSLMAVGDTIGMLQAYKELKKYEL